MKLKGRDITGFFLASRIPNLLIIACTQCITARLLMQRPWDEIVDARFFLFVLITLSALMLVYLYRVVVGPTISWYGSPSNRSRRYSPGSSGIEVVSCASV